MNTAPFSTGSASSGIRIPSTVTPQIIGAPQD
jgi:hypothetical protein